MKKVISVMLTVLLLAALTVTVCAEPSPTGGVYHTVEYITYETGEAVSNPVITVEDGETVTFNGNDNEKFTFAGFTIQGQYEIVSGSLEGPSITIRPLGDLVVTANYNGVTPAPSNNDNGSQSPNTGYDFTVLEIAALVLLVGLAGFSVAVKRLQKSKG